MKTRLTCAVSCLVFTFAAVPAHAISNLEKVGGAIYEDLNLSLVENQSCETCHDPSAGFADPENRISPHMFPVSDGSDDTLFGGRNAPTAAYAGFSPVFHHDGELFVGGIFWDGRATGRTDVTATGDLGAGPTGDPLADQAKGPFGNPVEMALSSEAEVVGIIRTSDYAKKFEKEFGPGAFDNVDLAYNNASLAIAAFERSKRLVQFKSKFDNFVKEQGGDVSAFGVDEVDGFRKYAGPPAGFTSEVYSYDEADGLAIFNADSYIQGGATVPEGAQNGAMCYLCHLTENHVVEAEDPNNPVGGHEPGIYNPMLTDFTYDNLGIPVNPRIAELAGTQAIDPGLGGQTAQLNAACPTCDPTEEIGKFKVSSLRNLSRTAPYGHNGFFATIFEIVHFYNTRDAKDSCESLEIQDATAQIALANNCWPEAEVPSTVNGDELGNLGLSPAQEQKLVLFLETLAD